MQPEPPTTDADPARPEAPRPPRRRRRRLVARIVLLVAALAFAGILVVGLTLLRMRTDLTEGRAALQDAKRALLAGRIGDAQTSFVQAERRFAAAADTAGGLLGRAAQAVPAFGNNVRGAEAIAEAGDHLGAAGSLLAGALDELPGGLDALTPTGGRLPLQSYMRMETAATAAASQALAAHAILTQAPTSFLLPQVRDARWEAQVQTADLVRSLQAGTELLAGLPRFAGSDATRRYLVVAQNPAELRGTGGIWGAYAILTFRNGRPTLSGAAPTETLTSLTPDQIPGVPDDYRRNYDQFGGAASWQNMNLTPDFPSAALAALANYEAGEGTQLDGVIAADPFALAAMLRVTGPVPVPGTPVRVSADTVVAFTTNEAYAAFPRQIERKSILGAVAANVIARFLAIDGKGLPRLRALADAVSGGHLLVYSTDPRFEQGLMGTQAGGGFVTSASATAGGSGDLAAVTVNNGSANKVDFYATRRIGYDVTLEPGGTAHAVLQVSLTNGAPTEGPPRYVLGPFVKGLGPGDAFPLITGWCRSPCDLLAASRDGRVTKVASGTEGDLSWYRDYRKIPAAATGALSVTWRAHRVWEGNTSGGVYRLTFLGQVTLRPTPLRISVTLPPGTRAVWSNLPIRSDGNTAVWQGTVQPRMYLEIRFQAPTLTRWWRNTDRVIGVADARP